MTIHWGPGIQFLRLTNLRPNHWGRWTGSAIRHGETDMDIQNPVKLSHLELGVIFTHQNGHKILQISFSIHSTRHPKRKHLMAPASLLWWCYPIQTTTSGYIHWTHMPYIDDLRFLGAAFSQVASQTAETTPQREALVWFDDKTCFWIATWRLISTTTNIQIHCSSTTFLHVSIKFSPES